jgi:hypothetical protein
MPITISNAIVGEGTGSGDRLLALAPVSNRQRLSAQQSIVHLITR